MKKMADLGQLPDDPRAVEALKTAEDYLDELTEEL
jgi:hypothetical protein